MTSSPGTDGRSFLRPVEGPATSHPPAPLIFKVLPAIKSRDQVIATARDIARLNGRHMKAGIEPGAIYDATGGERLLEAVGDAVIDVFGGCGYRAFYALNTTGEHPNVRLLVCAQNRRPPYRRLNFLRLNHAEVRFRALTIC